MLMGRPPPDVVRQLSDVVEAAGLVQRLGRRYFDPANSHQSFSNRHKDDAVELARMIAVGSAIQAHAFDLSLDRIVSTVKDRIDWRFESSKGRTPEFDAMLRAVRAAFDCADGIQDEVQHAPHVTFAYGAPERLRTLHFPAVAWTVDRIELVRRMEHPYRYETLASWPLLPALRSAVIQAPLF